VIDEWRGELRNIAAYAPTLIAIQHAKLVDPTMETMGTMIIIYKIVKLAWRGSDDFLVFPYISGRRLCTGCSGGVLPRQAVGHASRGDIVHPMPMVHPTPMAAS
jgi:hypothetical protein